MNFNCKIASLVVCASLAGFVFSETANAFQDVKITVAGLAIAKEDPDSEYGGSMVPGVQQGTTIYLRAHLPNQNVIKIKDDDDYKIEIEDSTGQNMPESDSNFGFMADISSDGKTVQLPIHTNKGPAKGAESIKVAGSVTLICGADPKTEEVDAEIAQGKKLEAAGIEFEISEVSDSFMNDDGEMFELQSKTSPSKIQSIEAVLADGKSVELGQSGSSEFGFGDDVTFGRSYDAPCKAADIKKLKVTFFQKVEDVKLPFDVTVGLGF